MGNDSQDGIDDLALDVDDLDSGDTTPVEGLRYNWLRIVLLLTALALVLWTIVAVENV